MTEEFITDLYNALLALDIRYFVIDTISPTQTLDTMNSKDILHYPTTEELWLGIGRAFLARGRGQQLTDRDYKLTIYGLCLALNQIRNYRIIERYESMLMQLNDYLFGNKNWNGGYINDSCDSQADKLLRADIAFQLAKEATEKGL